MRCLLNAVFAQWAADLSGCIDGRVVAVDGKTVRGSNPQNITFMQLPCGKSGGKGAGDVPARLYLIDGSGFIFRAFYSSPLDAFRRSDGVYTNAVNGYCSMLMKMIDRARDDGAYDYMAVIFDASRKNFRNDIYPEYKANRDEPPEELRPQFALIREATVAFGLPSIELDGYEADDLIATYAREARLRASRPLSCRRTRI